MVAMNEIQTANNRGPRPIAKSMALSQNISQADNNRITNLDLSSVHVGKEYLLTTKVQLIDSTNVQLDVIRHYITHRRIGNWPFYQRCLKTPTDCIC